MPHFWCPEPVQVPTNEQTYRERKFRKKLLPIAGPKACTHVREDLHLHQDDILSCTELIHRHVVKYVVDHPRITIVQCVATRLEGLESKV